MKLWIPNAAVNVLFHPHRIFRLSKGGKSSTSYSKDASDIMVLTKGIAALILLGTLMECVVSHIKLQHPDLCLLLVDSGF